mgnify:CR=1 FL=1
MDEFTFDTNKMTLIEALIFSKQTGKSFTSTRWSAVAQSEVQLYVYEGNLYNQNFNRCEQVKSISAQKLSDTYKVYEGSYVPYHEFLEKERERFEELKREIEPLYSKFQEYEKLLAAFKLNGIELEEDF